MKGAALPHRQRERAKDDREPACDNVDRQEHRYQHAEQAGRSGARGQSRCDEARVFADEPRLHLPKQMDGVATHRQDVATSIQMNLGGLVVVSCGVADRANVRQMRSCRSSLLDESVIENADLFTLARELGPRLAEAERRPIVCGILWCHDADAVAHSATAAIQRGPRNP